MSVFVLSIIKGFSLDQRKGMKGQVAESLDMLCNFKSEMHGETRLRKYLFRLAARKSVLTCSPFSVLL